MVIADVGSLPKSVRKAVKKKKKELDEQRSERRRARLREFGKKQAGAGRKKSLGQSLVLDTVTPLQRLAPLFAGNKKKKKGPTFT